MYHRHKLLELIYCMSILTNLNKIFHLFNFYPHRLGTSTHRLSVAVDKCIQSECAKGKEKDTDISTHQTRAYNLCEISKDEICIGGCVH
jgi:hypothetical protein